MKRNDVNKTSYRKEYWEYTGVDDREMGGDPMRQGELAHVRDIPYDIVCTMTEDSGEHCEEGEEEGGPVVDVGEEEVVDMDTTLGSKRYSHEEDNHKHNECKKWLVLVCTWPDGGEAARDNLKITKERGDTNNSKQKEVEPSP